MEMYISLAFEFWELASGTRVYFYSFYIVSTHLNQAVEEERSLILVYVQFELTYITVPQSVANIFSGYKSTP